MSLTSLIDEAGISMEDHVPEQLVTETVVSPVDQPSGAIPVPGGVVSTEVPVVEPVPVVPTEAVVPQVPVIPVAEANAALVEAEIAQVEANGAVIEAEQTAIKEKADELLDLQTSLESLQAIIRSTGATGISNQTAQVVQVQLKSCAKILGIDNNIVAIEAFDSRDSRAQFSVAKIALEDIKTSLKVSKNKFFALVEKLIAFFKKIALNYMDGINAVEKKVDALEERLGAMKSPGHKGTIKIHNAGLVLHDDSLDIPADIPGLAHFCAVAYPEALVKYLDLSTKCILRYDPEDSNIDRMQEEFTSYERPLQFLIRSKADKDTLPGGYQLDVSDDGMTFGLKGEAPSGVTHETELLSTVRLRRKARDMKSIIAQIREIRPEVDKIDKAGKRLVEASKRVTSKADSEDNSTVLFSAAVRAIAAKPRIDEVIKYLVRYLNAQIAICNTMADEIDKGKSRG